jgi:hypothetical protein
MLYYALAFAIYGFAVTAIIKRETHRRLLIFVLGLSPIFFLVICRANVGTDTAAYLRIISDISNNIPTGLELGFVLFVKAMLFLEMSPRLILMVIAFITTSLLVYAASFSQRSLLLIALCFVPLFYLDMTMNGLRYGLSFAFAMCAVGLLYQNRFRLCVIFAACAVLCHLSGWLIFVLMAVFSDERKEFEKWSVLTAGLGVLILILQNVDSVVSFLGSVSKQEIGVNLPAKVSAYMHFPAPSILSGLAPMALSLVALVLIRRVDRGSQVIRLRRFYLLLLGVVTTFVIAKFSYAGLRLQFVVLFFMLLCLQFKPVFVIPDNIRKDRTILAVLTLVGVLSVAMFVKNALVSEGKGPSPWLPYSFSSQLLDAVDISEN